MPVMVHKKRRQGGGIIEQSEVLVTEEMRRAGADELSGYDGEFESAEDAAERIFRAMTEILAKLGRDHRGP